MRQRLRHLPSPQVLRILLKKESQEVAGKDRGRNPFFWGNDGRGGSGSSLCNCNEKKRGPHEFDWNRDACHCADGAVSHPRTRLRGGPGGQSSLSRVSHPAYWVRGTADSCGDRQVL